MKEGLNKNKEAEDAKFESDKKRVERDNKQENTKYLATKFSEVLAQNPIVVYTNHEGSKRKDVSKKCDKVQEVRTDESGTGGVSVYFDSSDWVSVGENGFSASNFFDKKTGYYKITEESYQNILTMMNELIKASGYTEVEKQKMFQMVVDNFKGKILKPEDIEGIK